MSSQLTWYQSPASFLLLAPPWSSTCMCTWHLKRHHNRALAQHRYLITHRLLVLLESIHCWDTFQMIHTPWWSHWIWTKSLWSKVQTAFTLMRQRAEMRRPEEDQQQRAAGCNTTQRYNIINKKLMSPCRSTSTSSFIISLFFNSGKWCSALRKQKSNHVQAQGPIISFADHNSESSPEGHPSPETSRAFRNSGWISSRGPAATWVTSPQWWVSCPLVPTLCFLYRGHISPNQPR